jgi:DNA-binding FrmR family transcriptional regulator
MSNQTCKVDTHPSHTHELAKLNRIYGQVEGVRKMIQDERYCIDILTQLKAIRSAIKSLELSILDTHIASCVEKAIHFQDAAVTQNKIDEIVKLLKNFS